MDVLAVKLYGGDQDSDRKHHLSLVSHDEGWSATAEADFPFFSSDEEVYGNICRGLVYFAGSKGTIVVCNLTTRMWKVFPLPDNAPLSSTDITLSGCGLGYDAQSDDYKLLRVCYQYETGDGDYGFHGSETYTEVYSFRRGSWKKIDTPRACIVHPCAIYHKGLCYWPSMLDDNFGGPGHYPGVDDHILTFDPTIERFGHLSFPDSDLADGGQCRVFEYQGSLAALIHGDIPGGPDESLHINLFRRREEAWELLLDISLERVLRPLGFGESSNDYILYLEGYGRELVAYNIKSHKLEPLGITSGQAALIPACMIALCFDPDEYHIPGLTPMPFLDVSRYCDDKMVRTMRLGQALEESPRKKIKSKDEV